MGYILYPLLFPTYTHTENLYRQLKAITFSCKLVKKLIPSAGRSYRIKHYTQPCMSTDVSSNSIVLKNFFISSTFTEEDIEIHAHITAHKRLSSPDIATHFFVEFYN